MKHLIGIDLGTTGIRAMVFDEQLNIVAAKYYEYALNKLSETFIEQDANVWWELTATAVRECVTGAGITPGSISGLSVSSQGIAFVPVDEALEPLHPAISWLDFRAGEQCRRITQKLGADTIRTVTGVWPSPSYVLPKLLWLRQNRPGLLDRTYKVLTAHDFVIARMTGKIGTSATMAAGWMMLDLRHRRWSRRIMEASGFDGRFLPPIYEGGQPVGVLREQAAREMGLPVAMPVIAGGQDQKCAALGAGLVPGTATLSLGTATALLMHTDGPCPPPSAASCYPGAHEGWVLEGVLGTSTACLKWLKETLFRAIGYDELDRMAQRAYLSGCRTFFFPHMSGLNGSQAGFHRLSLATTAEDMVCSVYEGIAYQIGRILSAMEGHCGPAHSLTVFGGGAQSDVWCRIIADVTKRKVVTLYTNETACLGAAVLAGLGAGVFESVRQALVRVKDKPSRTYAPDTDMAGRHAQKIREYFALEERLLGVPQGTDKGTGPKP